MRVSLAQEDGTALGEDGVDKLEPRRIVGGTGLVGRVVYPLNVTPGSTLILWNHGRR